MIKSALDLLVEYNKKRRKVSPTRADSPQPFPILSETQAPAAGHFVVWSKAYFILKETTRPYRQEGCSFLQQYSQSARVLPDPSQQTQGPLHLLRCKACFVFPGYSLLVRLTCFEGKETIWHPEAIRRTWILHSKQPLC